eukprot:4206278-Pleurochrysis_carterae.AAC.1
MSERESESLHCVEGETVPAMPSAFIESAASGRIGACTGLLAAQDRDWRRRRGRADARAHQARELCTIVWFGRTAGSKSEISSWSRVRVRWAREQSSYV